MKHWLLCFLLFVLFSCDGQNQNETVRNNSLADKLVAHYNHKNYDSIFYLFSKEMKEALPLIKTTDFFKQMRNEASAIERYEFIDNKSGFDRYRADFSKGIYWLSISENKNGETNGLSFTEYDGPGITPLILRNSTKLSLPFSGEWFVFWGGDTKEQNYHVVSRAQKNAFDFIIIDEKKSSFKTNGKENEDYYAFGQPIFAPCNAAVVSVIENVQENVPGEMNSEQLTGNTVILKTAASEYLLFAHLKFNSIKVKTGDILKKGEMLGLCGNSGNSSEPHLHFHIQDRENMVGSIGVKCYFEKIFVNDTEKNDYSPVKNDRIKKY